MRMSGEADKLITKFSLVKILGIMWHVDEDLLTFDLDFTIDNKNSITNRVILSQLTKIYDPVVISLEIFMQRLWQAGVSWDEVLPIELSQH